MLQHTSREYLASEIDYRSARIRAELGGRRRVRRPLVRRPASPDDHETLR